MLLHLRCDGEHVLFVLDQNQFRSIWGTMHSSSNISSEPYNGVDNSSQCAELTVKPAVTPHRSLPPPLSLSVISLLSSKVRLEDDVSSVRDVCRVY